MIKLRSREEQKLERLNLVPIMDAVFIFIFFLLFSAQFIELVLLEAEAPVVSNISSPKDINNEPLNLNIKILDDKIEVYTGIVPSLSFRVYQNDLDAMTTLNSKLVELRKRYPDEDEVIISPLASISYDRIVKVIEASQIIPKGNRIEVFVKNKKKILRKVYSQVVLEPLSL